MVGPVGAPDGGLNGGPPDQPWAARTIETGMTADRASRKILKRATWKEAYNLEEIHACVQEAVAALRAWEASAAAGGPPPHGVQTSSDLLNKKFNPAKFRQEGYEQDEVDEFLDEIAEVLKAYESRSPR
ncbi:DivIVA domain-containing protein [Actinomyces gerencseriae]|uniref:DivIVA domain-containing protein n=1 Tax=Actinomyces gerencseriae TaxID=52769 RepID=UPI0036F3ABFF